jgi:hypothetical protein
MTGTLPAVMACSSCSSSRYYHPLTQCLHTHEQEPCVGCSLAAIGGPGKQPCVAHADEPWPAGMAWLICILVPATPSLHHVPACNLKLTCVAEPKNGV